MCQGTVCWSCPTNSPHKGYAWACPGKRFPGKGNSPWTKGPEVGGEAGVSVEHRLVSKRRQQEGYGAGAGGETVTGHVCGWSGVADAAGCPLPTSPLNVPLWLMPTDSYLRRRVQGCSLATEANSACARGPQKDQRVGWPTRTSLHRAFPAWALKVSMQKP